MLYPIYVHPGDGSEACGVTIPDFPGCFSAADDMQDIPHRVQEAVEVYCEGENLDIPAPSPMEDLLADSGYEGGVWAWVDIDLDALDSRKERINLSVPRNALREIDAFVAAQGTKRSGFMVRASLQLIRQFQEQREA